jgi:hypothetical protein
MKKEITIKIVINENKIGSIMQKSGFNDDISSMFEIIGILRRVVSDEELRLNQKLTIERNFKFKEPLGKGENGI